jgi:DnaD/phage-associated family protein
MTYQKGQQFSGFQEDDQKNIRLPEQFFTGVLPQIDDLPQLKLLLYLFWHSEKQDTKVPYFRLEDLLLDPVLIKMTKDAQGLKKSLADLVEVGVVLQADLPWMDETYYFINSPQGRAAVAAIDKGAWQTGKQERSPIHLVSDQPNIFKLYEENIGPITPMMAEILKMDEAAYPNSWINEAIEIAVTRNARNWKYVQAILARWQKEGRGNEQYRRDDSQDPESYRKSWLGHE